MKHEIHTRHYQITLDKLLQPTVADAVGDAPFLQNSGLTVIQQKTAPNSAYRIGSATMTGVLNLSPIF